MDREIERAHDDRRHDRPSGVAPRSNDADILRDPIQDAAERLLEFDREAIDPADLSQREWGGRRLRGRPWRARPGFTGMRGQT
jgi:hypothetical protein